MLLKVSLKVCPSDRFVADDAVHSVNRFLHVDGKRIVGIGVSVVGGYSFVIRRVVSDWRVRDWIWGVCRCKYIAIWWVLLRRRVHGNRRIARCHV
jgi:hypothetical protein